MYKFSTTLFLLILLCQLSVLGQLVNVPDSAFRGWLINHGYGSCMTGDSIDSNCSLVQSSTHLYIDSTAISDLSGISAFSNLDTLFIRHNYTVDLHMTSLPSLTYLYTSDSHLNIDTLPSSLKELYFEGDMLTHIP